MSVLSQHIEYLLMNRDCVILPGIGAFIATYEPARIDAERGLIMAPQRVVTFNPDVVNDDGLLVNSVARRNGVSFEEARRQTDELISEFRRSIDRFGRGEVGSLGTLNYGPEGTMLFRRHETQDRISINAGRSTVRIPADSAKEPKEDMAGIIYGGEALEVGEWREQGNRRSGRVFRDGYYNLRIPKWSVRVAALAAVVIVAGLSLLMPMESRRVPERETMASIVPLWTQGEKEELRVIDQDSAVEDEAEIPDSEFEEESSEPLHYLIVGTFPTRERAESYIAAEGREDLTLCPSKSGVWRVAAGSGNENELRHRMNDPIFKARFSESWIWSE